MTVEAVVPQIFLAITVAITTSILTVWLSLHRYYREKWWDAKMHAYTAIIQSLHHMKHDLEISISAAYEHRDTNSDYH